MANYLNVTRRIDNPDITETVGENWHWLLGLGISLALLGVISLTMATLTTLISVIALGVFLMDNGAMLAYQAIKIWRPQKGKFFAQLIISILYILGGLFFIINPIKSAVSITLVLAILYIILGLYRSTVSIKEKVPGWKWLTFSGVVTSFLGLFILAQWPGISLVAIGALIGIDILLIGWSFIMSALSGKKEVWLS